MNKKAIKILLPYLGLVIVAILFEILSSGKLLSGNNLKLIVEQSILVLTSAIGVLFVMTTGGLDFSQGAIIGIASIVMATVSKQNILLAVVLTLLVGITIGVLNGVINAVIKVPSFIVTICTMMIFRGLTVYYTSTSAISIPFSLYNFNKIEYKVAILLLIIAFGAYVYKYTYFGHACRAIGSGEKAARYSGIQVTKIKIMVFAIAGLAAGVATCLNIVRTGSATANTGNLQETNVMIALVLGGLPVSGGAKSRFSSAIIGSILIAVLSNGLVLIGMDTTVQQLIKGLVFLIVVAIGIDRKNNQVSK